MIQVMVRCYIWVTISVRDKAQIRVSVKIPTKGEWRLGCGSKGVVVSGLAWVATHQGDTKIAKVEIAAMQLPYFLLFNSLRNRRLSYEMCEFYEHVRRLRVEDGCDRVVSAKTAIKQRFVTRRIE